MKVWWTSLRWGTLALALFAIACTEEDSGEAQSAANAAPTISGTPSTSATQNAAYAFMPTAADADGDPLVFGIDSKPLWAAFDTTNGLLSGTPTSSDVGTTRDIVIWVSDGKAETRLPAFDLTVSGTASPTNSAPTISGTPAATIDAGAPYLFTPAASDGNGDPLTFSIRNRPPWATFTSVDGRLQGTPFAANAGRYADIVISVSDGKTTVALAPFSIDVVVAVVNREPQILGSPLTSVEADSPYAFVPTASDPDGDALTFSITGMPAWAEFNEETGALTGTPTESDVGTYSDIVISVSDGKTKKSLPPHVINVKNKNANSPPVISGTPQTSVNEGVSYAFQPTASDANSDPLTFTVANRPAWATFNTTTGLLQGKPGAGHAGTYNNIVVGVTDGRSASLLPAFSITVIGVSVAPVISGTPAATATVGVGYSFQPTASDANNDALTFSIANKPAWATFSATTGRLQGTPTVANFGTYANILISVSDGTLSASLPPFTITIANRPPTISGTPGTTATVGTAYAFTPTGSDPDGQTLTYSIANKPAWATFTASSGRLAGTPTTAGSTADIVISVSDGMQSASLPAFTLTVSGIPNRPPTISGAPPTSVIQGTQYSFTPTASDADGDVLTFSIVNKPAWATFSAATGRLEGTPTAANLGTTTGIVISVSDGAASAALPAFNVAVQAVTTGSATLSWLPPTQNSDGSPLTDLAGFKVYWGTAQGNYPNSVTINNAGITTYLVENLVSGTHYFVATAFDTSGNESTQSNVASKTIP